MAVIMKASKSAEILAHLFGQGSQAYMKVGMLEQAGAKVVFGLFNFQVTSPAQQVYACKLPQMSMHITNGSMPSAQLKLTAQLVEQVIEKAFQAMPGWPKGADTPEPEPITAKVEPGVKAFPDYMKAPPSDKEAAATAKAKTPQAETTSPGFKPVLNQAVVKLRDAKAVSQKVTGTSGGSVYRAFAIGEVNLAVKMGPASASIRAEARHSFTTAQRKALAECGFSDHQTYMSIHLNLGTVPVIRVLGAVAFSLNMPFDQIATSVEAFSA